MKVIAYGKKNISEAVKTAEAALALGVKKVIIECAPEAQIALASLSTLAFCPVAHCGECQSIPCPFGHKSQRLEKLQAEYDAAEEHLNGIAKKLREASIHG